jgi:hypothetical protein
MKFAYRTGQRPLVGYTIKRGIGRGGFGEVYFAVSDGGKEVALKVLNDNEEVELRGVAQCLNLKHPHLVSLYDLRRDAEGNNWVVMEHVAGEPLSVVLTRHAGGVPRELVREWFLMLAKAVAYLHDHGIVHRDLKPGNIFLENGLLKVGDYGLSKAMGSSRHLRQTQSVGTVHYMAPEISTGNYNKQIDIYAAGVILYEMLTGRVPFEGQSAGEILMKHMTAGPDLSKLPPEYVPIVAKALAKNPAHRYASMTEFARAVEAVGQPRESEARPPARPTPTTPIPVPRPEEPLLTALPAVTFREQVSELCGSLILTVLFALIAIPLWATLARVRDLSLVGSTFFLTVAACWAVLIPSRFWADRRGDSWARRVVMLAMGAVVGFAALWLDGWTPATGGAGLTLDAPPILGSFLPAAALTEAGYISYFALSFFAFRWWRLADRKRSHRIGVAPLVVVAIWAVPLMLVLCPHSWRSVCVLVLAALIIQLVSPWQQPTAPKAKRLRLRYS